MWRALLALALSAGPALADIVSAQYDTPTDRYPHAILGGGGYYTTLRVTLSDGTVAAATWQPGMVFEDTEPRLVDVTGDGAPEVITVESHDTEGARLGIWALGQGGALLQIARSPHIGQRFRWLAPIAAADLDGDGAPEIAWIDRPHLAKTLEVWRFTGTLDRGRLTRVAGLAGLTNHRIGETDIAGGLRDCGDGPELITADADWQNVMATRLSHGTLTTRAIAPHRDRGSFDRALACR